MTKSPWPVRLLLVSALLLTACLGAPGSEEDEAAAALSTGTGLQADYFAGTHFQQRIVRRTDPTVNFNWTSAPWAGVPFGGFSVRWTGEVEALQTGTYTFSTTADDGVRLWVDGVELVNDWSDHAARADFGSLQLKAGVRYGIKMEYYNSGGATAAKLFWQLNGGARQIVPAKQLYPSAIATYGTLGGDASKSAQDVQIGATTTEFVVNWGAYEPARGAFSATERLRLQKVLAGMKAAGMKPTLSFSLHYLPNNQWICSVPGANFIAVDGTKYCGKPFNLVFSQPVRNEVIRAIEQINTDFGLSNFSAVRVQTGGVQGEISYPKNGWWAFDGNANSGGSTLPTTLAKRPNPAWHPGDPADAKTAAAWLDWYVGALADAVNFQIDTYYRLGFRGKVIPVMPGKGVFPADYAAAPAKANNLASTPLLGQGVAWYNLFGRLHHRELLVAYTSSLAEKNEAASCTANDRNVKPADASLKTFDVGRYMAWIAHQYGTRSGGENPGVGSADYGVNMMKVALDQVQSCGMSHFYWAHESTLYDNGKEGVRLQDYANFIADHGGQFH